VTIENRPYAGTWVANRRSVIQWTPDFLLYLNGDTALHGCATCHHNIDINEFVNSISVDFGVEPGASNCSVSMSVPRHYGDSIFRDGNTLLRPGLEVHVYFRGYFPMRGLTSPNARPVAGINLADIPQYPYYPVFHGVITQVAHEYSGGFYTASLTCNGMLHFWEHLKLSGASGGSFFGARPANSGIQTTLTGHPMSGKSPYSIIYSLYRDTAGVADGVGFALASRTNYGAVNTTTNDPLYSLTLRYWEQRFRGKIYGLRMHGASGQLFTSSQQAFLSINGTNAFSGGSRTGTASVSGSLNFPSDDAFSQDIPTLLGMGARGRDGRVLRQVDTILAGGLSNSGRFGLDVAQLQAFPTDIGAYGQVNLWESTYESKMDIATAVTNVCGYEFYQDADGDLVFKPPLYNLDTSSSRVYRIEPEDVISINFTESEPAATYCVIKGGAFQNTRGLVDESEWGCRSTYVDYKLVAQFGWIEASLESSYYTNPKSAFFFAINHLDRTNAGVNGCTVTIPLRPEIRPGYPVYIRHIDCFYYVTQVSHAFNLGSECTTSLTMTARRRKFLPPGEPGSSSVALDRNLTAIDLSKTANPVRALHTLDNSGVPRIIGFPNVVMAIDPFTINPMFTSIGFQAVERELTSLTMDRANQRESATRQRTNRRQLFVWNFIRMMLNRQPAILNPVSPNTAGTTQTPQPTNDFLANNSNQQYAVCGGDGLTTTGITVTVHVIQIALSTYINNRSTIRDARAILTQRLFALQNAQRAAQARAQRGGGTPTEPTTPAPSGNNSSRSESTQWYATLQGITDKIEALDRNFNRNPSANIESYITSYTNLAGIIEDVRGSSSQNRSRLHPINQLNIQEDTQRQAAGREPSEAYQVVLMSFLTDQFRVTRSQSNDLRTDPSGTVNASANLLEMLSDRKAALNLTVPGHYRYYSASHPNPDMQGYASLTEPEGADSGEEVTEISVDRNGRPIGERGQIVSQFQTRMSGEQAAVNLRNAWRTLHGQNPSNDVLAILLAQWALESGTGTHMYNYNYGGVHWDRNHNGPGMRYKSGAVGDRAWYQGYANEAEGARHYVWLQSSGRHREGIAQYELAVSRGYGAAGRAYAEGIRRSGYYRGVIRTSATTTRQRGDTEAEIQADIEDYGGELGRQLVHAHQWIANAHLDDDSTVTPRGDRDPAANPTGTRPTASSPETDYSTAVVVPITNNNQISPDRLGQYVELSVHNPTKGLRVRVIENDRTKVLPTNRIYAMTFEARGIPQSSPVQISNLNPHNPQGVIRFIDTCLNAPPGYFTDALANTFVRRVGTSGMSQARNDTQVGELITAGVAGITGLRNRNGQISASSGTTETLILNITDGTPNNYNPNLSIRTITGTTGAAGKARAVLQAKARALIKEVTVANITELNQAKPLLHPGLSRNQPFTQEILALITPWQNDLIALFNGATMPTQGPFQRGTMTRLIERTDHQQFSPVFPVSDELGYEHYGSFQYGRGLSIEPGGNYERLMATDPLQFATDIQREAFLRALRSHPGQTQEAIQARAQAVREALTSIASDPEFRNGPGLQVALDYLEPSQRNGDRTTQIANGLANYIMSDRDAVMKMPVNNAAYRLADLLPQGQDDSCGCRGAEADLLLAAYMSGTQNFTIIDSENEAVQWVGAQMIQAAQSWSQAQQQMRGMAPEAGRRSLLDNVEGWQRLGNSYRQSVERAGQSLGAVATNSERTGERAEATAENIIRSPSNQRPVPPRGNTGI